MGRHVGPHRRSETERIPQHLLLWRILQVLFGTNQDKTLLQTLLARIETELEKALGGENQAYTLKKSTWKTELNATRPAA